MTLVAELMEKTGKPIINVPDTPIRGSVFDFGGRYRPIVLVVAPGGGARSRSHGMVWCLPARNA